MAYCLLPVPFRPRISSARCAEFNSAAESADCSTLLQWTRRHQQPTVHSEQPRAGFGSPASQSRRPWIQTQSSPRNRHRLIGDVTRLSRRPGQFRFSLVSCSCRPQLTPLLKTKGFCSSRCRDRDQTTGGWLSFQPCTVRWMPGLLDVSERDRAETAAATEA